MVQLLHGREHVPIPVPVEAVGVRSEILFGGVADKRCLALVGEGASRYLQPSYYVGADWLRTGELAVHVQPKLNGTQHSINHLRMLFDCLKHSELSEFVGRLYYLDVNAPFIELPRRDDLLTPLLVGHFLYLLQEVVRQGLKKGYNPVARELRGRVKGKLDIGQTLRQGVFRQRPLSMFCAYTEFGVDIPENRLLKQALRFARRYLSGFTSYARTLDPLLRFCEPAFEAVSDETVGQQAAPAYNPLYRAYTDALRVGWLLLKRFGYSLLSVEGAQAATVRVPPHWIDMAYLFELYVLSLLRDQFGSKAILYGEAQAKGNYGLPDFLLPGLEPWIIDAKYRPRYQRDQYFIEDIRQLSGYARDKEVLVKLGITPVAQETAIVRCLLVYPDRLDTEDIAVPDQVATRTIPGLAKLQDNAVAAFTRFYKLAVRLPYIND
jgi:5-methylcytosine-specific restriction enzyme subunit McrC